MNLNIVFLPMRLRLGISLRRRHAGPPLRADKRQRVLRNHQFFVGGDDLDRHGAVRGRNARTARSVRLLVQLYAKPRQLAAQRRAHRG